MRALPVCPRGFEAKNRQPCPRLPPAPHCYYPDYLQSGPDTTPGRQKIALPPLPAKYQEPTESCSSSFSRSQAACLAATREGAVTLDQANAAVPTVIISNAMIWASENPHSTRGLTRTNSTRKRQAPARKR